MEMKVGVFDSGIGGLTVLKSCMDAVSDVTFYYYGDNGRAPYGAKSAEEIMGYATEAMELFSSCRVNAVVLACNTVTALCVDKLRANYSFPIIGVEPAVKTAAAHCKSALLLATPRTIESERVRRLVAQYPSCRFTLYGASRLAELIERKALYGEAFSLNDQLPEGRFDGVVLGCTHYVYVAKRIAAFYNRPVFYGNPGTAKRLASLLATLEEDELGIGDHSEDCRYRCQKLNKCLKITENSLHFLGKYASINKKVYFSKHLF